MVFSVTWTWTPPPPVVTLFLISFEGFFKLLTKNTEQKVIILFCVKEYSSDVGDPYYPVPNPRNQELYSKYQKLATEEEGVTFVGRLASYKYFNMDQAILNALELFDKLKEDGKVTDKKKQ